eukprot:4563339-Pyramimonas_sp.AAC.1
MPRHAMPCYALTFNAMLCDVMFGAAVRCHALRCKALRRNSLLRHATPCCDILRFAVLFYAIPRRVLQCIAYHFGIIALLDIG